MGSHQNLDYHEIIDGIFVGTNQCCKVHFEEELLKKGITADISLEEERLDAPFGVEFYLWLPTKDHTSPSSEQLELGISVLQKLIEMKKKIYVHCKNGHGRAPTLVAAYCIKTKGSTPEGAEELLKSKRSSIHLQDSQKKALEILWNSLFS